MGPGAVMHSIHSLILALYILFIDSMSFLTFVFLTSFLIRSSYLFTSLLIYFLTYLLFPEQTHSVLRPEVVGGNQTWL